jgi:hypothetical protein
VFHEEMRQAVALLCDLPEVDARAGFEERVWSRIAVAQEEGARGAWGVRRTLDWIREWIAEAGARPGWVATWSVAGVAASLAVLTLVSSEPAPSGSVARKSSTAPSAEVAGLSEAPDASSSISSGASTAVSEMASSEDEFVAEMPEAVREYLDNAKDLRLPGSAERYRRANYSYPIRRVEDPSLLRVTGESSSPSYPPSAEGTGEESPVISF